MKTALGKNLIVLCVFLLSFLIIACNNNVDWDMYGNGCGDIKIENGNKLPFWVNGNISDIDGIQVIRLFAESSG